MSSLDESVTADVKFAQVPHWVLELPLSDKAVRLYTILSKYADNSDGTAYPGRGTLAKLMRCHRTSVDRAIEELIAAGCITKQVRYKEGRFTSSLYTVKRIPPRRTDEGSRTHATTRSRTDATTSSHPCDIELEPVELEPNELLAAAPPKNVKKKEPDLLFEAIAKACGIEITQLTGTSRGQLNKATKELRDIQATPEQVTAKAAAWRRQYETASLTPTALVKHWPSLTIKERKQTRDDICSDCFQPFDDHDPEVHALNAGRWR